MPVVRSEEVETKNLFPGFEMQFMVDRAHGSQAITVISETLHPGGKIPTHKHKVEEVRGAWCVACAGCMYHASRNL